MSIVEHGDNTEGREEDGEEEGEGRGKGRKGEEKGEGERKERGGRRERKGEEEREGRGRRMSWEGIRILLRRGYYMDSPRVETGTLMFLSIMASVAEED